MPKSDFVKWVEQQVLHGKGTPMDITKAEMLERDVLAGKKPPTALTKFEQRLGLASKTQGPAGPKRPRQLERKVQGPAGPKRPTVKPAGRLFERFQRPRAGAVARKPAPTRPVRPSFGGPGPTGLTRPPQRVSPPTPGMSPERLRILNDRRRQFAQDVTRGIPHQLAGKRKK